MSFAFDSASMNAMIHDGLDPNVRHIYYRCDKCHYPYFYVVMEEEHPLPHGRLNIRILLCPKCGAKVFMKDNLAGRWPDRELRRELCWTVRK